MFIVNLAATQSRKYLSSLTSEQLLLGVFVFVFTKGAEQEINECLILTHYAFFIAVIVLVVNKKYF